MRFHVALPIAAAFLLSACQEQAEKPGILDAAHVFSENEVVLQSIRAAYPGPYPEFSRVPSRDTEKAPKFEADFLKNLRADIPVEFIDFFPIGDTGRDEINVVMWRYQNNHQWNTVSLVYFSIPMTFAEENEDVRAFDSCDGDVRDWIETREKPTAVFCRINENWHAYQRVE